ncbi:MAG: hypothetical protein IH865_00920 [Chloroflexi bacterium]|nr:hypothetical protein [Chloroflexota bacterium]
MDTGKQINAMVVVLLLTVISVGAYALFDPFRADTAEDDQLAMSAYRAGTTFALNCRLCHGDRGEGGVMGGRLPAAPVLDRPELQGIDKGVFNVAAFNEQFNMVTNVITCGRAGTFMPTWGRVHGGTLSEEQVRQLAVLITGGDLGADPYQEGGFWEEAQDHADEIDAETTEHSTLQMPGGSLSSSETDITVSNAAPLAVDQFIRIDGERMRIVDIPTTGQRLIEEIGRTPDELFVTSSDGIEIGDIIRLGAELLEVSGIREDGDFDIALDASTGSGAAVISLDDPAFFSAGIVVRAGNEQIEIVGPVKTGQLLAIVIGRAQTTISVTGTAGIEVGMQIRMGEELLEVLSMEPATITIERGSPDLEGSSTTAATHTSNTQILELLEPLSDEELDEGVELEDPDTGQTLIEALSANATTIVVSGIVGISAGQTYQIGNELVRVTETQPAVLRVERGVGGTDRGEHSRRVSIFEGNLLEVERGVLGTSAASHETGTSLFFDVLEVEREVGATTVEDHAKNSELFLGQVVIVERGVLGTDPEGHENGTLVLDHPAPPNAPTVTGATCGQNPPLVSGPVDGPVATPRDDAEQVGVSLVEFEVIADPIVATGEPIDFTVNNDGTTVHNFRYVATGLAPDALPVDGQTVDESQFDEVGGFADALASGDERVVSSDLAPGTYVLFCNVPTHYGLGMYTAFEVTGP